MAIMQNNHIIPCQTVTNIRYNQMAAQSAGDWTAVRLWQEKELAHLKGPCRKCNQTWFAPGLWPGQVVTVGDTHRRGDE